ncbi:MAG: stage II sporulation protein M [Akkermansiaceae bacterium]
MKEQDFEAKNLPEWRKFDATMEVLEKGDVEAVDMSKVPAQVRARCLDLSLARYRLYGSRMCEYLNHQVTRGHNLVAKTEGGVREKMVHFFVAGFPQAMRREWRLLLVCWLFFLVPFFGIWASYNHDPEWVHSLLGEGQRSNMDEWYGKGSTGTMRDEFGSNFAMFGHYINNNIGIDLLIIAGGALAGVGSLFLVLSNGLQMGAAMAYVMNEGSPERLLSFVSGHAPYELLGMIVAGMAGMRIGLALIKPGQLSRGRALMESGTQGLPLIIGACVLTFVAAIIEGFWSAEQNPVELKYWVGYIGWFLLAVYFIFAGRNTQSRRFGAES